MNAIPTHHKPAAEADELATVPPGYKRTQVGLIPKDWELRTFGDLCIKIQDGTHFSPTLGGNDFLYVTSRNIGFGCLNVSNAERISVMEHRKIYARCDTQMGDLLLTKDGANTGNAAINQLDEECSLLSSVAFLRFDMRHDDTLFYLQFVLSEEGQQQIKGMMSGNAITRLTLTKIRQLRAPSPPLTEQRAIAEALSDVDGLLRALEALIAKKQAIKQATMQQLLTGKTRLPSFNGPWKTRRLGGIGHFLKGKGVKRDDAHSGPLPCVRYGELYTTHDDYIQTFQSWISHEVAATATRLQFGDLLFAGSGETKEEIGKCVAFVTDTEAYAGGDIVILRPKDADSLYLGYAVNVPYVARQKARLGQGDAVVHISATALAQISLTLPSVKEQSAIATVLTDMDAEIVALERRRDKTRAIKQGMMQQLLTGRIRLVKTESKVRAQTKENQNVSETHNWAFNEAVVISKLTKHFGKEDFPLGRKRYTKLSYLFHRHTKHQVEGYLKKAAGPYNPKVRYGGPESIALKSGYIRKHKNGKYSGFVEAENIDQAESYFDKWYSSDAIQWLEQFRFKKNDELEVLATVDMAAEELRSLERNVNLANVKNVIGGHPEWKAKLDRAAFSDTNIVEAIQQSARLSCSSEDDLV